MGSQRSKLSKKTRFEVLKRDAFACQYCGAKAPEVVLHIDHVNPVASGGGNELINLTTSCAPCNFGKSDRLLSDGSVVAIQRKQADDLQERRNQIDMLIEWNRSLQMEKTDSLAAAVDTWQGLCPGYLITATGKQQFAKSIKRFGLEAVIASMHLAAEKYLKYDGEAIAAPSVGIALGKIGPICTIEERSLTNPNAKTIAYACGILRNRVNYCNYKRGAADVTVALEAGVLPDEIFHAASRASSQAGFARALQVLVDTAGQRHRNGRVA